MTYSLGDIAEIATALIALGGVIYGTVNLRAIRLRQEISQASRVYLARRTHNHLFGIVRERYTVLNNSDEPVFEAQFSVAVHPRGSHEETRATPAWRAMGHSGEVSIRCDGDGRAAHVH